MDDTWCATRSASKTREICGIDEPSLGGAAEAVNLPPFAAAAGADRGGGNSQRSGNTLDTITSRITSMRPALFFIVTAVLAALPIRDRVADARENVRGTAFAPRVAWQVVTEAKTSVVHEPPRKAVTVTDKDKAVILAKGDTLVVKLPANLTTGFSWIVVTKANTTLRMSGQPEYSANNRHPTLVGAGGTQTFRFIATRPDSIALTFHYKRSWEKDAPPARTYILNVTVK